MGVEVRYRAGTIMAIDKPTVTENLIAVFCVLTDIQDRRHKIFNVWNSAGWPGYSKYHTAHVAHTESDEHTLKGPSEQHMINFVLL